MPRSNWPCCSSADPRLECHPHTDVLLLGPDLLRRHRVDLECHTVILHTNCADFPECGCRHRREIVSETQEVRIAGHAFAGAFTPDD